MKQAIIFDYVGTLTTKADEQTHVLRPEAEDVLALVHKAYRIGIISKTKDPDARMHELQSSPLASYASHLQTCREKTPEVLQTALKALGVSGNQCYAVDDRVRNFPLFNQFGCETIWLRDGFYASEEPRTPEERPHRIIASLSELVSLLL